MAFHYVVNDRDQLMLLPVSVKDWLEEGHLAWFILDVIEHIDCSTFHARHPNDGPGRPAYDPEMMLGLLFYAYCTGQRSSRVIERLCRTDAAYRVLSSNLTPDHATLSRFVVNHEQAIENTFVDVLGLCAAAGLVTVGTIAIDGTKIGADAALDANHRGESIRAEIIRILGEVKEADHQETDQPDLFGDVLPPELGSRPERLERLEAAAAQIALVEQDRKRASQEKADHARRLQEEGKRQKGKKPKDPHDALIRAEIDLAIVQERFDAKLQNWNELKAQKAELGKVMTGRPPTPNKHLRKAIIQLEEAKQAVATAVPEVIRANTTDPDSRVMMTKKGYIQGFNAQAAVNENHIIIASSLTQQANDLLQYQPMVKKTIEVLKAVGIDEKVVGKILADAGYWSDENATAPGPGRLIATLKDHKQRATARLLGNTQGPPPEGASTLEAMEHILRTPEGAALYAIRSHTVEPTFGNLKENKGFRFFRRRGLTAVTSEWSLMNVAHNLGKLFDYHQSAGLTTT
jgi:transposase